MSVKPKMPTYFLSHGAGPWPWMGEAFREKFQSLEKALVRIPGELPEKPKAVLMISGHWEEDFFSILSNPHPPMYYDYFGFPENTYRIQYPAPGSPELAAKVQSLIKAVGIEARFDSKRGFDHGAFTPMGLLYPHADVPLVQLSLRANYDAKEHIKVGQAIRSLRTEGILIVGSGLSYHNLRVLNQTAYTPSQEFDAWLQETLIKGPASERLEKLSLWERAPSARQAHPQEDHLLPLMVAAGAAEGEVSSLNFHTNDFLGFIAVSSFRFG